MTGGVYVLKSHIHRCMLNNDYYQIHFHEVELQTSIQTKDSFVMIK